MLRPIGIHVRLLHLGDHVVEAVHGVLDLVYVVDVHWSDSTVLPVVVGHYKCWKALVSLWMSGWLWFWVDVACRDALLTLHPQMTTNMAVDTATATNNSYLGTGLQCVLWHGPTLLELVLWNAVSTPTYRRRIDHVSHETERHRTTPNPTCLAS